MISEEQAESKRPVSAALTGPYGHPFHPMLVTVPIGAWVSSFVFDIASRFVDEPEFLVRASQWLIAVGVVGALVAASVGFLDFFSIPSGTRAHRTAVIHMSLNLGVTVAYAANFFWRHSSSLDGNGVPIGQIVLSVVTLAALATSGALGGELAYRYGVRVADEATQAEGFGPSAAERTP